MRVSFLQVLHSVLDGSCRSFLAEVKPVKFSSDSFLVLQFKDSYRREQQRKERESNSARKRRAVSSSKEQFSVRFRTRGANGLLFLAIDSTTTAVSGYTVLEVSSSCVFFCFSFTVLVQNHRFSIVHRQILPCETFPVLSMFSPALRVKHSPPLPPLFPLVTFSLRLPFTTRSPPFRLVICFPRLLLVV